MSTTAMINAYAAQNEKGFTGEQILNGLTTSDGSLKDLLYSDGSLKSLSNLSMALAKACGLDSYLSPDTSEKIPPSLV